MIIGNPNPKQLIKEGAQGNVTLMEFFAEVLEKARSSQQPRAALAHMADNWGVLVCVGPFVMMEKILSDYRGEPTPPGKRGS